MKKGSLIVISGPSGAGKGTICAGILAHLSDVALSISMTTRSPRTGETDGKDYFFVSEDEFRREIEAGGFLEYACVFGNYYGTPKRAVAEQLESGIDVILEIDTQGAMKIKDVWPEAIFIFIMPPSRDVLKERLRGRGTDSDEVIARRLREAESEMAMAGEYDYRIINDDLDEAVSRIADIIEARRRDAADCQVKA